MSSEQAMDTFSQNCNLSNYINFKILNSSFYADIDRLKSGCFYAIILDYTKKFFLRYDTEID